MPPATILDIHHHSHDKYYALFTFDDSEQEYLYIYDNNTKNRALIFGKNLKESYFLAKSSPTCIECNIINVEGGITQEGGEILAHRITLAEANKVLSAFSKNIEWILLFGA